MTDMKFMTGKIALAVDRMQMNKQLRTCIKGEWRSDPLPPHSYMYLKYV